MNSHTMKQESLIPPSRTVSWTEAENPPSHEVPPKKPTWNLYEGGEIGVSELVKKIKVMYDGTPTTPGLSYREIGERLTAWGFVGERGVPVCGSMVSAFMCSNGIRRRKPGARKKEHIKDVTSVTVASSVDHQARLAGLLSTLSVTLGSKLDDESKLVAVEAFIAKYRKS